MSNVVFILPFKYQPPITVILLGWPVQLSIHICAMKDHSILVSVDPLALQGVINVVPFQRAGKKRKKTAVETIHLSKRWTQSLDMRHSTTLLLCLSFDIVLVERGWGENFKEVRSKTSNCWHLVCYFWVLFSPPQNAHHYCNNHSFLPFLSKSPGCRRAELHAGGLSGTVRGSAAPARASSLRHCFQHLSSGPCQASLSPLSEILACLLISTKFEGDKGKGSRNVNLTSLESQDEKQKLFPMDHQRQRTTYSVLSQGCATWTRQLSPKSHCWGFFIGWDSKLQQWRDP